MKSTPTFFSLISSSFVLLFSLSTAIPGNAGPSATEQGSFPMGGGKDRLMSNEMNGDCSLDSKTIKGRVMSVENDHFVVKGRDGKERLLYIDRATQMGKNIVEGQNIYAKVNDQNEALFILSAEAIMDRRNDKE